MISYKEFQNAINEFTTKETIVCHDGEYQVSSNISLSIGENGKRFPYLEFHLYSVKSCKECEFNKVDKSTLEIILCVASLRKKFEDWKNEVKQPVLSSPKRALLNEGQNIALNEEATVEI